MIKVILHLDCGPGMSSADAFLVSEADWVAYNSHSPDNPGGLSDYAWEAAVDFASTYGIYPESDRGDDEEDSDDYSDDINGYFELYNPKQHDGLMIGTQREWEWKEL